MPYITCYKNIFRRLDKKKKSKPFFFLDTYFLFILYILEIEKQNKTRKDRSNKDTETAEKLFPTL